MNDLTNLDRCETIVCSDASETIEIDIVIKNLNTILLRSLAIAENFKQLELQGEPQRPARTL